MLFWSSPRVTPRRVAGPSAASFMSVAAACRTPRGCVCAGAAPSEDTAGRGVWLGRHICESVAQMSQGELSEDRNPTWSRRANAHLIRAFRTGTDRESVAYRTFGLFACLQPELSENLPKGLKHRVHTHTHSPSGRDLQPRR